MSTHRTVRLTHARLTGATILVGLLAAAICTSYSSGTHTPTTARRSSLVQPGTVHLAGGETIQAAAPVVHVAEVLYTFWNTGNAAYLDDAVSSGFHDNTLPAGRAQGRNGILSASEAFRAAVPDLRCQLVSLYITGTTFTAQQIYSGHFTGMLDGHHGYGQPIRFNAIDIQHVGHGGKITEDWHLEDTLTFLDQAGVVNAAP